MYLKALEIQGFKSFPEKTRITFEKDIIAIVGPNGSGKSNISDAVRWVMGEQSSRTLRGGKMEDVIFGGTERRGQVGFAEVSLIIDNTRRIFNTDSSEIMLTRRYYRSGESEYYINRESVRLKDVNEMLMDTGLGRDGYAIIDQGRIAEILSLKSIDRRDIFEEAAGISRFRHRKEEAERKLEKTDENLTRIGDKISELELQVGPLREQAETAKKYLVLRDRLRETEISLWLENLDKCRGQSAGQSAALDAARRQMEGRQTELEEMYAAAEDFTGEMRACDVEAEEVRARISQAEAEAAERRNELARLETNVAANRENIDRMSAELSEHDSRADALSGQILAWEERIREVEEERKALEKDTAEVTAKMDGLSRSLGGQSDELTALLRDERGERAAHAEMREKLSALLSSLQQWLDRETALDGELVSIREKLRQTESDAEKAAAELDSVSGEAVSLANTVNGYELRLKSRREKCEAQRKGVMDRTMELESVRSRINLLSEMEREYEGYSRAVKLVMREKARGTMKNIHGPAAEHIEADDEYALAIETALGAAAQHIIVDTPEDGKYAINFLKRQNGGRATFLPLASVKGTKLREKGLESFAGFIGLAVDLIQYGREYEGVYTNLLGRTAVVSTIDDAVRMARAYGNRFRIVTVDGQVINAGGSMTGGSAARGTGVLSRANEIKKLKAGEGNMASAASAAAAALEEAELSLRSEEGKLAAARNELRQLEDMALKCSADKRSFELLRDAAAERCRDFEKELAQIEGRRKSGETEADALRAEVAAYASRLEAIRRQADTIMEGQETLKSSRDSYVEKLSGIQAALASLETERLACERSVRELRELAAGLSGDREQKDETIARLAQESESISGTISEHERLAGEIEAAIEKRRRTLSEITARKMRLEAERTVREQSSKEKNREMLDMERECARLEQKRSAADMEEKQILDKLWDTYELSYSAALEARKPMESIAAAGREAAKFRKEIGALGTPNIGAIEEFERVGARYDYLTEQRDDVENAKRELVRIIGNITTEMREIFAREFENIGRSFKETFTELFGGGKAALEMEDEADILNCGIEIRVQPPGKSLKTITLLSGGEKAFVAIALYFSILKIRPTPFCVMDEIEAALDEANVLRFAEYMRKLSKKTQFIAITHRRGTMEEADVLYGVTMQEQGVSKVISVDLEEAEKTIK